MEPPSVVAARLIVETYDRQGICPTMATASVASVWTCRDCDQTRPPTIDARTLARFVVRCALAPREP